MVRRQRSCQFSLIKGSAEGEAAQALMRFHLEHESLESSQAWFARVPTEANISDFPSRGEARSLLKLELSESLLAQDLFDSMLKRLADLQAHAFKAGKAPHRAPVSCSRKGER